MTLAPEAVLGKKLVLVTGKGGIGKTAVAGALGALGASLGKRTIMVESSHRDQIAPLFGRGEVGHNETNLVKNLSCINLKPAENFREYVTKYLGQKRLYDTVFSNRVVRSFINTIPGFSEVMMLGRLFYGCELAPNAHDLTVFDGYASGHFLSLMTTPDAVLNTKLGGPLVAETERVKKFLSNKDKVGVLYVLTPEPLVVSEAMDFLPKLHEESPASLMGIIVNRSWTSLQHYHGPQGAIDDYIKMTRQRAGEAMELLQEKWKELPPEISSLPIMHLPDVGAIPEPMTTDSAKAWVSALFEGGHK